MHFLLCLTQETAITAEYEKRLTNQEIIIPGAAQKEELQHLEAFTLITKKKNFCHVP